MEQKEMPNRHLFSLLYFMIHGQTTEERTLAMIAQRDQKQNLEQIKENLPKEPNAPIRTTGQRMPWDSGGYFSSRPRTGKHNRTMLSHDCWFFKKPELNSLTVEQCIETYPRNFIWAYENLAINWSEHVVSLIKQRYPLAVRKIKEPINF